MREAMVNGQLMVASPKAPDAATCPACGAEVHKRKRRNGDGTVTWFWRHKTSQGAGCPRRYTPT